MAQNRKNNGEVQIIYSLRKFNIKLYENKLIQQNLIIRPPRLAPLREGSPVVHWHRHIVEALVVEGDPSFDMSH